MVTVWNFKVTSDKFSVIEYVLMKTMCISGLLIYTQ